MYFSSLHGQALDFSPRSSGAPTVCRHGTYSPLSPIRSRQVGVGPLGLRELLERPHFYELAAQRVVLLGGAVAPVDRGRLRELGDRVHPGEQVLVLGGNGGLDGHLAVDLISGHSLGG